MFVKVYLRIALTKAAALKRRTGAKPTSADCPSTVSPMSSMTRRHSIDGGEVPANALRQNLLAGCDRDWRVGFRKNS